MDRVGRRVDVRTVGRPAVGLMLGALVATASAAAAGPPGRPNPCPPKPSLRRRIRPRLLPSGWEVRWGRTDPHRADTDGDGRPDSREDPDRDGLDNRWEYRLGLAPHRADTDHDGRPDGHEDTDHDGLTNLQEIRLGLDPTKPDSDGDHIKDGADDLDGDRLSNHFELRWSRTDPTHADTDHNGIRDGAEDPDHDLLSNAGEERAGTNPHRSDTDRDGRDGWHEHPNNMFACEDRRRDATSAARNANDRSAADEVGVSYRPTTRLVCPYDPCPVVIDRFLLTGDDDHLLPPFSASLSRGLERLLPARTSAAGRR